MHSLLFPPRTRRLRGRADCAAAFSIERVRDYAGPLVRVRRSGDNLEADLGAGLDLLPWSAIAGFVGAGSGFATKWYDQSGQARDLVQATAAAQPQLILASNGLPALKFDGLDDIMFTAAFTLNQPWTLHFCWRPLTDTQGGYQNAVDGVSGNYDSGTFFNHASSFDAGIYAGDFGPTVAKNTSDPVGTRAAIGAVFNATSSILEVNGATVSSYVGGTSSMSTNAGGLTIGSRADAHPARFAPFEAQELSAFNTAHSQAVVQQDNRDARKAMRFA